MSLIRKLKPDRSIQGALISMSLIAIFILATIIFDLSLGFKTSGVLILLFGLFYLYVFIRTGNNAQLTISADGAFFGYMLLTLNPNTEWESIETGSSRWSILWA